MPTLHLSEKLYQHLEGTAHQRGFQSIEQLLEAWEPNLEEAATRQEAVAHIDTLRERLFAKYGRMPDSTPLLREDRDSR